MQGHWDSIVRLVSVQVFEYGVDEWLALCMHFKRLSDKYPDDWQPPPESDDSDSDMVHSMFP